MDGVDRVEADEESIVDVNVQMRRVGRHGVSEHRKEAGEAGNDEGDPEDEGQPAWRDVEAVSGEGTRRTPPALRRTAEAEAECGDQAERYHVAPGARSGPVDAIGAHVGDGESEDREQAENEKRQAHGAEFGPGPCAAEQEQADGRGQERDAVEAAVEGVDGPRPEPGDGLRNNQQRETISVKLPVANRKTARRPAVGGSGSAGGSLR